MKGDAKVQFTAICDELYDLSESPAKCIAARTRVESLLEALYDCKVGKGESLKKIVVGVQQQLLNATWTSRHVEYLLSVIIRVRGIRVIDESTVKACWDMARIYGLNPFRSIMGD